MSLSRRRLFASADDAGKAIPEPLVMPIIIEPGATDEIVFGFSQRREPGCLRLEPSGRRGEITGMWTGERRRGGADAHQSRWTSLWR
jgi:hypothetical protein